MAIFKNECMCGQLLMGSHLKNFHMRVRVSLSTFNT